jgi:hypothetical protein
MAMSGKICGALAGLRIRAAVVRKLTHRTSAFAKPSRLEYADAVTRITTAKRLWFHNKGELIKPIAIGVTWSRCVPGSTHVHRASSCSASLRMGCTARFGPHTFLGPSDSSSLVDPFGATRDSQHLHRKKAAAVAAAVISSGSPMQLANEQMARLGIQHVMLVSASMGMVVVCLQVDSNVADWILAGTWAQTMPATVALFGLSDLLAQTIEKRKSYNLVRAASASCVGIVTCNFGFGLWLHHLEALIPGEAVSLTSLDGISALASKSLLDSAVWGTISNSINIFGRRMFAGDSVSASEKAWRSCILNVTKHEFKFWPFWQAFNFSLVPYEMQVQFTALGAFVWNTYLSMVARKAAKKVAAKAVAKSV